MTPESTRTKLAAVLRDAGLVAMARAAAEGRYDDFLSPSPTPIGDLVRDLETAGRADLAARARAGEWDATREEAEAWAQSPDGHAVLASVTPPLPAPAAPTRSWPAGAVAEASQLGVRIAETSYRRGFHQALSFALAALDAGATHDELRRWHAEVSAWRRRPPVDVGDPYEWPPQAPRECSPAPAPAPPPTGSPESRSLARGPAGPTPGGASPSSAPGDP